VVTKLIYLKIKLIGGYNKYSEFFMHWLATKLPRKLVYYCTLNAAAHATTGKYSGTIVPELTAMDCIKRFGDDHKV